MADVSLLTLDPKASDFGLGKRECEIGFTRQRAVRRIFGIFGVSSCLALWLLSIWVWLNMLEAMGW